MNWKKLAYTNGKIMDAEVYRQSQVQALLESDNLFPEVYGKLLNYLNTYRDALSGSVIGHELEEVLGAIGKLNAVSGEFYTYCKNVGLLDTPPHSYGEKLCGKVDLNTISETPCWASCNDRPRPQRVQGKDLLLKASVALDHASNILTQYMKEPGNE